MSGALSSRFLEGFLSPPLLPRRFSLCLSLACIGITRKVWVPRKTGGVGPGNFNEGLRSKGAALDIDFVCARARAWFDMDTLLVNQLTSAFRLSSIHATHSLSPQLMTAAYRVRAPFRPTCPSAPAEFPLQVSASLLQRRHAGRLLVESGFGGCASFSTSTRCTDTVTVAWTRCAQLCCSGMWTAPTRSASSGSGAWTPRRRPTSPLVARSCRLRSRDALVYARASC